MQTETVLARCFDDTQIKKIFQTHRAFDNRHFIVSWRIFLEGHSKQKIKNFDNIIDDEIRILNELSFENKIVKINKYVKDELQKIMSYLKLGRKFNDTKQIMIDKIIAHYK